MGVRGSSAPVNRMARRLFSDDRGKVLREEERAAENIYIKKKEHESIEKLKQKLEKEKKAGEEARKDEPSS